MSGSPPQDVYATNLEQNFGYPLRSPEPNGKAATLQPYASEGFQIGDVGYVNDYGEFILLFNIGFPPDDPHELCVPQYKPIKFDKSYRKRAALPEGHLFITGAKQAVNESRSGAAYKFTATSNAGAILILPSGATLSELQNKRELEAFRKAAAQHALDWCEFAERDSLYLVTGLYRTRSWTLGSFYKGLPDEEILVDRHTAGSEAFKWTPAFQVDYRAGPRDNNYENQTVLIKGFRMTVRWSWLTVIERVTRSESRSMRTITYFVAALLALLEALLVMSQRSLSRTTVEQSPRLSQPLHPSDLINRYLLDKNPGARVAVTHDSEWIDMLEKERLSYSDLMQDGPLREFLAKEYVCHADDSAVYLQSQIEETDGTQYKSESSQRIPATENVQTVITHIRAENVNIGLGRIPIGFYVQLDFDGGTPRRTRIKPVPVCDSVIQWDDLIQLPSDLSVKVRLVVCASFEFVPVLGKGEPLHISEEISVGSLLGRTDPITFCDSEGEAQSPRSSLLVTVQQWHCNRQTHVSSQVNGRLNWEASSELAKETDLGHDARRRYRREHCKEDLESSVAHFERALDICPHPHTCRAAALSNLATATFIIYQFDGTSSSFNSAIALYREALKLRCDDHPDRPTTLLHLSQALLHHYGVTGHEASPEGELQKFVDEVIKVCPEGSHERRAADLVLQTYEWYRLRDSDDLAEFTKLITILDVAAREPPESYFDRPIRFHNLGVALLRRFGLRGEPSDLDEAITWLEKTIRVTPNSHLDKPRYLSDLGNALLDRFQRLKDVGDLDRAIASLEDAARFTADGHRTKPTYVNDLSNAFLGRFQCCRDVDDLGRAISGFEDVIRLIPDAHA